LLASQAQEQDHGDESASEDGSENGEVRAPIQDEEEDTAPTTVGIEDEDDDNDVVVIRDQHKHDEADEEAQTDFDREFARMLADTTDARRERKAPAPIFDTAVPLIKRRAQPAVGAAGPATNGLAAAPPAQGGMNFTLLSKRGNKQQMRNLDIPLDSAIAVNSMSHQQRNKAEQEQLKRLVLQNERRLEKSEMQGELVIRECDYKANG